MTGIEKARQLFRQAGLAFPTIPKQLAARLKERGEWLFATRELKISPFNLDYYVPESHDAPGDYAVLCHSGYGVNSYAMQYYLVYGPLQNPGMLFTGGPDRAGGDDGEETQGGRTGDDCRFGLLRQLLVRIGAKPREGKERLQRSRRGTD
jgi:hypothetical protein